MWTKENPNFFLTLEHHPPHDMMWTGVTSTGLIGPYFYEAPVYAKTYSEMLEDYLIPQLRDRGLLDDMWFQQHGTPAHFALCVRNILNKHFPGGWIDRSSSASPAPLAWPPRSPDLTTPNKALWGIIKDLVSARRYYCNNDLRRAVENAFTIITPELLKTNV